MAKEPFVSVFECRCCGCCVTGHPGSLHDAIGTPWRWIARIDGPNAICPDCVVRPDCLDTLVEDGSEHASIEA